MAGAPITLTAPKPASECVNAWRGGHTPAAAPAIFSNISLPAELAMTATEHYECTECGHRCTDDTMEFRRTLDGRAGHIDDWIPDEFVSRCPGCGSEDTYCEVKETDEDEEVDE